MGIGGGREFGGLCGLAVVMLLAAIVRMILIVPGLR